MNKFYQLGKNMHFPSLSPSPFNHRGVGVSNRKIYTPDERPMNIEDLGLLCTFVRKYVETAVSPLNNGAKNTQTSLQS